MLFLLLCSISSLQSISLQNNRITDVRLVFDVQEYEYQQINEGLESKCNEISEKSNHQILSNIWWLNLRNNAIIDVSHPVVPCYVNASKSMYFIHKHVFIYYL